MRKAGIKAWAFALAVAMVMTVLPTSALADVNDVFDDSGLVYQVLTEDSGVGTVAVSGIIHWTMTEFNIPETVTYNGTVYEVTEIGAQAFDAYSEITRVTIPDTVTVIGDEAFSSCMSLESIIIGEGVTDIGASAFYQCTALTSPSFGSSITHIGPSAFARCNNLATVTLPNSVEEIGDEAFSFCGALEEITLPASLTTIGARAFEGCVNLLRMTFKGATPPDMGSNAFNRTPFATINVPSGHVDAYYAALAGTDYIGLVRVAGSRKYDSFNTGGLAYCVLTDDADSRTVSVTGATDTPTGVLTIPDSVVYDGDVFSVTALSGGAFKDCTGLTGVTMGNSITYINGSAFENCSSLTSITFPASVTTIDDYVFWNCNAMESITFESEQPPAMSSIAFWRGEGSLLNLSAIYVPAGSVDAYKATPALSSFGNGIILVNTSLPMPSLGVTVGGVAVTNANKDAITGDGISGSVSYDPVSKTLTLDNASIPVGSGANEEAIYAQQDLTVRLVGNNVLGVAPATGHNYAVANGIFAPDSSVTLTGGGNLTIYDRYAGIVAKNITVNTTGRLTISEYGTGMACCLKADGGTLTINSGTLVLSSQVSNALYGDSIRINGGTITALAKNARNEGYYAFNNAPAFGTSYRHDVYAGNSVATAQRITNPTNATFTASKYVKIAPATTGGDDDNGDDDGGDDDGGDGGGSGGSGSGGSSGGSSASGNAAATGSAASLGPVSANVDTSGAVTADKITAEAKSALQGTAAGGSAIVRTQNAQRIAPATLNALAAAAQGSGKSVVLHADTLLGNAMQGRIYLEPAKFTDAAAAIQLGVYTDPAHTAAVTGMFGQYFDNTVRAVTLAQQGSFGARIQIAAKVDLTGLNTQSLIFYAYNAATNGYTRINNPAYLIDANGYLHFYTELGGSIIITDKPLTKR